MGSGGSSSNTHIINRQTTDETNNHNNVKNLENYYKEHNLETNIQNGDRALGGAVNIRDDVNAGTAIYKLNLMNLDSRSQAVFREVLANHQAMMEPQYNNVQYMDMPLTPAY